MSTTPDEHRAPSAIDPPLRLTDRARWGVAIGWASDAEPLLEIGADAELRVASVSKLLLLAACAAAIESGDLDPGRRLDRRSVEPVADSGIWQHLDQHLLTVHDVATLVGAASDNLATNVLLHELGLDRVIATAEALGVTGVHLHDRVRDERTSAHPQTLGTATARGLLALMTRVANGTLGDASTSARVRRWLANSLDLSMVAAPLHLDPLSHGVGHEGLTLVNKTGTDAGVRADAGCIESGSGTLVYCAIANWPAELALTDAVMNDMHAVGEAVRRLL